MPPKRQPGVLPVSALHGRASASADAARIAEIERIKALSPKERMLLALRLGQLSDRLRDSDPQKPPR